MGATLSKLWAAIRGALNGSAPANNLQNANTTGKDVESGTQSPAKTIDAVNMAEVKKYEITEPWLRLNCSLGEGPFWEDDTNCLRFLDVEKQRVHRVDLNIGPSSHTIVKEFDVSIGCTADIESDPTHFVFAGKYGYGIAHKSTGVYHWIKRVWTTTERSANKPHLYRGNDGAVDSSGRFWAGFMFDPLTSPWDEHGALFRLNVDGSLDRALHDIAIPNGAAWSADDRTMYWADSPKKTIYAFDFDPATGAISNQRPWFVMPEDERYGKDAVPDGHCIDEEGYMWTALHGGSHVLRISPAGDIVAEIKVPTKQPTCPCFVGEDLVITSAGGTSGEGGKGVDEFAGSVFRIHVGVRGLKKFKYKGVVEVEDEKVVGE